MEKYAYRLATRTADRNSGTRRRPSPRLSSSRHHNLPDGPSVVSLRIRPTAIDRVPGNVVTGACDALPSEFATLQISVLKAIFGYPSILFQSPKLVSTVLVPSTYPFNPFDIALQSLSLAPRSRRTRHNHAIRRGRIELVRSM